MLSENELMEVFKTLKKKIEKCKAEILPKFLKNVEKEHIPEIAKQLKKANKIARYFNFNDILTLDECELFLYLYKNYIFDLF